MWISSSILPSLIPINSFNYSKYSYILILPHLFKYLESYHIVSTDPYETKPQNPSPSPSILIKHLLQVVQRYPYTFTYHSLIYEEVSSCILSAKSLFIYKYLQHPLLTWLDALNQICRFKLFNLGLEFIQHFLCLVTSSNYKYT